MKYLYLILVALLFVACSDAVEDARKAAELKQADSLRSEIRKARSSIDSLRKQSESIRKLVDSLDMSPKK